MRAVVVSRGQTGSSVAVEYRKPSIVHAEAHNSYTREACRADGHRWCPETTGLMIRRNGHFILFFIKVTYVSTR